MKVKFKELKKVLEYLDSVYRDGMHTVDVNFRKSKSTDRLRLSIAYKDHEVVVSDPTTSLPRPPEVLTRKVLK